jgi:hypothetical protein
MARMLSEVPIEEIRQKCGELRVLSVKGTPGKVVYVSDKINRIDYDVEIKWDNGEESVVWHFEADNLPVIDGDNNENEKAHQET